MNPRPIVGKSEHITSHPDWSRPSDCVRDSGPNIPEQAFERRGLHNRQGGWEPTSPPEFQTRKRACSSLLPILLSTHRPVAFDFREFLFLMVCLLIFVFHSSEENW